MNIKSFRQTVILRTLSVLLSLSLVLSWFPHTALATQAPESDPTVNNIAHEANLTSNQAGEETSSEVSNPAQAELSDASEHIESTEPSADDEQPSADIHSEEDQSIDESIAEEPTEGEQPVEGEEPTELITKEPNETIIELDSEPVQSALFSIPSSESQISANEFTSREISTYAVNATPSTSNKKANFYVNLDGAWTCIGTLDVTVSGNFFSYTASLSTSDIVELINTIPSADHALSSSDFKLYYANNSAFTSNTAFATIGDSSTTLGSYFFDSSSANAAKYIRVMTTDSTTSNLTPLAFYTVTLDYPDRDDTTLIVPAGSSVPMPEGYTWSANGSSYSENEAVSIEDTVTFVGSAGTEPDPGPDPVTYTVTCINGESTTTSTVNEGDKFTLPDLGSSYVWVSGDTSYSGGEEVVILGDITFTATAITYTVTCVNGDSTDTTTVIKGDTFTLPSLDSGYRWVCNGTSYSGGQAVVIQSDMTFTAEEIPVEVATIDVTYNVNFPTGSTGFYGTSFPASPTLAGTTSATTVTDTISEPSASSIRDVSSRTVSSTSSTHGAKFQMAIYFSGWETESGDLIEPNTILSWSDLVSYDYNGDGVVDLEGSWSYGTGKVANFCIRYDGKTGQSDTSTTRYTPSLFTTYVGGSGSMSLDGTTDKAAYEADQQIRALYGNWGGELWLSSFPTDEYIFNALKSYASSLTVNDKSVNVDDLNAEKYAIRWYMIKKDSGDGWHIDGRLFEKTGQITVDKEFYGDETAVEQAEDGFYVMAVAGSENANGEFEAYAESEDSFKQYILVLDDSTASSLASSFPDATFQTYDADDSDPGNHAYEWLIEGVTLGELWQITEYPVSVDGYNYYTEYSVYDTDGVTTALAEYGTSASVVGKTFALDENPDQGMLVDFRNYYYGVDSIFIKTEDGDTGLPLPGAGYELWQAGSDGEYKQLTFSYDADADQYVYDSNGAVTQITSGSAGFAIISTVGFSYTLGDVLIKEVTAPSGYSAAPNITLTSSNDSVSISDLTFEDGASVSASQWSKHAELEENGDVLVVKNYSADPTSVTVEKVWADNVTADSVTVVLQANGSIASNAFPGMTGVQVTLNDANNWSYTWTNLPSYANGAQVEWSIKETKIGDEITLADGVSFANWTVVYSPASKTDSDSDGNPENWAFTVTNTVRRTQLFLTKTDTSKSTPLAGAEFTLVAVEWSGSNWTQISGATLYSGTSDANGLIHFDALVSGAFYMLTETNAPTGYSIGEESIVLTLDNAGQVFLAENGSAGSSVLAEDYHTYTSPYNISVTNIAQYSCTISAPDSLVFTYEAGGYLWNPETMKYEQQPGRWVSDNGSISVTNTTASGEAVSVEAVFTPSSDNFVSLDYVTMSASISSSVTREDETITLSSTLSGGEQMYIYITLDENTPAFTSGNASIGTLSIRVRSPRRRLTRRLLGKFIP